MRTSRRRPGRRVLSVTTRNSRDGSAIRTDAEQKALDELRAWRAHAVPDSTTPLGANDLVRLLRECFSTLGLDPAIAAGFTVNTVHYYRRKDIIDPPDGRTAAARYGIRHVWQVAGARLAGYLGLVTLAEARSEIRDANASTLLAFLAARVADARARHDMRRPSAMAALSLREPIRPLPGVIPSTTPPTTEPALMIALPGNAWCIVPAAHDAHHSREAASALGRALAAALRDHRTS